MASTPCQCICRGPGFGSFGSISSISMVHLEKESNWAGYISAS